MKKSANKTAAPRAATKGGGAKRPRVSANSGAASAPSASGRRAPAAAVMKTTKRRVAAMRAEPTLPGLEPQPGASWPALKLEIVRRYASAYSHVMSRQAGLAYYYIEGFSGPDVRLDPASGDRAPGNPLDVLRVEPPFRHHFLVDIDGGRAPALRRLVGERADVTVLEGDGNALLLNDVLPRVRADDYRRALCVLDPCGSRLDWRVIEAAGRLRTIDLFVGLPVADEGPAAVARRLREEARFENVLEPVRLAGPDDHHLFFASRANTANHVIEEIFAPYRAMAAGDQASR